MALEAAYAIQEHFGDALRVRSSVPARTFTTFQLGGIVDCMVDVAKASTLPELLRYLAENRISYRVLGAGSNIVVSDNGLSSVVIRLGRELTRGGVIQNDVDVEAVCEQSIECFNPIDEEGYEGREEPVRLLVYAGAPIMTLSRKLSQSALAGLEFAAGIPASLGGAIKMNAGAHGSEMSQVVTKAYVATPAGAVEIWETKKLDFAYRHSAIGAKHFVLAAELSLQPGERSQILGRRTSCLSYRRETQPLHFPSAGSVFKNPLTWPEGVYRSGKTPPAAAEMLEKVGLKGERLGSVAFSEMHANWIVKVGDSACASDVISLMKRAEKRVHEEFGLWLESEITVW